MPAIAAGGVITVALVRHGTFALLPGMWCATYALGLFASRALVPQPVVYVAVAFGAVSDRSCSSSPVARPNVVGHARHFGIGSVAIGMIVLAERSPSSRGSDTESPRHPSPTKVSTASFTSVGGSPSARAWSRARRAQLYALADALRSDRRKSQPSPARARRVKIVTPFAFTRLRPSDDAGADHDARAGRVSWPISTHSNR